MAKFRIFKAMNSLYLERIEEPYMRQTCITTNINDNKSFVEGLINIMERDRCTGLPVHCDMHLYSGDPRLEIWPTEYGYYFYLHSSDLNEEEPEKEVGCGMSVFTPEEIKKIREMVKWFSTKLDDKFNASHTVYDKDNSEYRIVKDGDVVLIEVSSDIAPQSIASLYFSNYTFKTVKLVAKYDAPSDRYEVKYSNDTSVYVRPDDVLSVTDIYLHEFIGTGACGGPTVYE